MYIQQFESTLFVNEGWSKYFEANKLLHCKEIPSNIPKEVSEIISKKTSIKKLAKPPTPAKSADKPNKESRDISEKANGEKSVNIELTNENISLPTNSKATLNDGNNITTLKREIFEALERQMNYAMESFKS